MVIRDFIYVDVERLYSLYSQMFEGVAEQIIQSYESASARTDSQKDLPAVGKSIEAQVAEVSRRTESRFLYDHMYNALETRLGTSITEPQGLTRANYREVIGDASLIKVTGKVKIEDYSRVRLFMEKFNELGEGIAYAISTTDEMKQAISAQEETVKGLTDRNQKARAQEILKKLKDPKQLAKEKGFYLDPTLFKYLDLFTEMFYSEGFEIAIIPATGSSVGFRGIADRRWLRVQPDLLRARYGGFVDTSWTMVGQITFLPSATASNVEQDVKATTDALLEGEKSPSMRDRYRALFTAADELEKLFLESYKGVEILLSPIAIYNESSIPDPARD